MAKLIATAGLAATTLLVGSIPVLFASRAGATSLSAALADAPKGLIQAAATAGQATGVDAAVLLAIAKVECSWGRCQTGQPDELVPAEIRAQVNAPALQPGGATALMLGLADGRRIGDWVNPTAVGAEHAMGFMQFLPSTWRQEAALAPGGPRDPYSPQDAMLTAGSYLHRLIAGALDGRQRDLRGALTLYGGSHAYADQVLSLADSSHSRSGASSSLPTGQLLSVTDQTPVLAGVPPGGWPHSTYPYGQCTWWGAFNRLLPPYLGDAWQWLGNAARSGYRTSAQPAVGAIVVYGNGGGYSDLGHVGIVVEVRSAGFVVSETNYVGWAITDQRLSPWPDPQHVEGFIL